MTLNSKKNRIIFIDLLRAFAVLQMVQGHTVDVLLSNDYRNFDSTIFSIWFFMRGMTAPIFLFTSGTVFTYLLRLAKEPFLQNNRVKKGLFRFVLLVSLGYLMRYPTATVVIFADVTPEQWATFFTVDVLHLIGFGILFIMLFAFISEKVGNRDTFIFSLGALIFFGIWPFIAQISWTNYFPVPIAAYFYEKTGSLFPLFPWVGYLLCGAMLGSYLAKKPLIFRTTQFSLKLAVMGFLLIFLFIISKAIQNNSQNEVVQYLSDSYGLLTLRVGFVLILISIVSFVSLKLNSIPKILVLIGRNTLLIYVIHLVLLFGSAWSPGIILLFDKSLNVWNTTVSVFLMIITMTIMVIAIHRLKIRNKEIIT